MNCLSLDCRWLACLLGLMMFSQVRGYGQSDLKGFTPLFDGTSTRGWRGYGSKEFPAGWVVEDGALHRRAGGGDIMTEEVYQDFELRFEWKVAAGGNSGVIYRVREQAEPAFHTGPEYQILDDAIQPDGKILPTSAASLYGMYPPSRRVSKCAGSWNEGRIIVRGDHVQHWLNGELVVDCHIGSEDWNERLKKSKFATWPDFAHPSRGHIVLQDHGDAVWFRQLYIKPITSE